jgi:hypothetical protein
MMVRMSDTTPQTGWDDALCRRYREHLTWDGSSGTLDFRGSHDVLFDIFPDLRDLRGNRFGTMVKTRKTPSVPGTFGMRRSVYHTDEHECWYQMGKATLHRKIFWRNNSMQSWVRALLGICIGPTNRCGIPSSLTQRTTLPGGEL